MLTGRLFQILGAATANARDAVTVLVLGCCNRCLAEEQSGHIGVEFCMIPIFVIFQRNFDEKKH